MSDVESHVVTPLKRSRPRAHSHAELAATQAAKAPIVEERTKKKHDTLCATDGASVLPISPALSECFASQFITDCYEVRVNESARDCEVSYAMLCLFCTLADTWHVKCFPSHKLWDRLTRASVEGCMFGREALSRLERAEDDVVRLRAQNQQLVK